MWTITETATAVSITCNGVELVNLVFSDSSFANCVARWSRDGIWLRFVSSSRGTDTASDEYRAEPSGATGTQNQLRMLVLVKKGIKTIFYPVSILRF